MDHSAAGAIAALIVGERWFTKDTDQHWPARRDIARLAYHMYEARGRQHGHDIDDWLRAERHLALAADRAHQRAPWLGNVARGLPTADVRVPTWPGP